MIPKPIITAKEAAAMIKPGFSIMCSGFMGCGAPFSLTSAAAEHCPHRDLTLISSDHSWHTADETNINGVAPMIKKKMFKKAYSTHVGLNSCSQELIRDGEMDVTLMPMGTYVERVRCGGSGLGGVLTPVGIGTEVEQGKQVMEIDGKKYLLELPLRADIALLHARKADKAGNLIFNKTARNFNPLLAMAADLVIVEVEELVEIGDIDPDLVHTPFIFVDYIVPLGGK
ncbi:MAG: CoA transferase subunit A [Brevinema sp.]